MCDSDDYFDTYEDGNYEEDDDIDVEDVDQPKQLAEECQVLSEAQVLSHMNETIKDMSALIELSPTVTRTLLNHLKWDTAKLGERFCDDRAELFKDAQITDPGTIKKNPICDQIINCEICFLEYDINECFSENCGHYFCHDCWDSYLNSKILDEGLSSCITCPQHNCFVVVEDANVRALIVRPEVSLRFNKGILNAYIQCNVLMRPCPTPDCGHVIQVEEPGMKVVQCVCQCEFCFSCGKDWHSPVKCDLLLKWCKKNRDDSETSNWIAVNTKDCPKCRVMIEKDGGCNHMVCRNVNCNFEFCWVCLGQWSNHGAMWYHCVRYDEEDSRQNRSNVDSRRIALNRYLFYFTRYSAHLQSLKFEKKLKDKIQETMEILQKQNFRWIEVQFLLEAVAVLCNCRKTLMHTYVFSYYLERNNESAIFESNQKDLQEAVETLSHYLENFKDIMSGEELKDHQQKIQDKFRYCEARRKVLLEHVKEGHERDKWRFLDL